MDVLTLASQIGATSAPVFLAYIAYQLRVVQMLYAHHVEHGDLDHEAARGRRRIGGGK